MKYMTLITRGKSRAEQLADAIEGVVGSASVYVVGISDDDATEAFAKALTGELTDTEIATALAEGSVTVSTDLDAKTQLMFGYVEAIGTEDERTPLAFLISTAKHLAGEFQKAGGHREYKKSMQRFAGRVE